VNDVDFADLTPEIACEALATAGLQLTPGDLGVEAREERWLVRLPGQRLAWFAQSEAGRLRLVRERRVLRLVEAHCRFSVPRLQFESADGRFDVRTMVPGNAEPWAVFARARDSTEAATQIGAAIGAILADQHAAVPSEQLDGWLPHRPEWPEQRRWVRERLPGVIDDVRLIADADAVMAMYEGAPVADSDRVLVHSDVGFHNLGIDARSLFVHGLFDYDGAACADRHHDFRYLLFDVDRYDLFDAARRVYEPLVGRAILRDRAELYNAACAVTYLAYRLGAHPEQRSCGRTLAQDLRWSRHAISRVIGT
jgi:hypothetical protein